MTRREALYLTVEVASMAAIVYGVALIFAPAAWIAGGLGALALVVAAQMGGGADAG